MSRTTIHGRAALLFGLPFAIAGALVVLVAVGVIEPQEGSVHAPMWVVGVGGGVFLAAGIGLALHGLAGVRRVARLEAHRVLFPNEPWLADHPWDRRGVASRGGTPVLWHVFGLSLMGGLLTLLNWVWFAANGPALMKVVAGFFDLVFVGVLAHAGWRLVARRKYGTPHLLFDGFPFHPGEDFRGRLLLDRGTEHVRELVARLRFIEERYETRGTGRDRSQHVVCFERYCEERVLVDADAPLRTDGVAVEFALPEDGPPTRLRDRPASFWDLEVRSDVPGVDFVHRFLVPVYERSRSAVTGLASV